jgi:hypothetical protein
LVPVSFALRFSVVFAGPAMEGKCHLPINLPVRLNKKHANSSILNNAI